MGYSRDPATAEQMLPFLEPLLQGQECAWRTSDPSQFAYKVREAFYIAEQHPHRFPTLSTLRSRVRVRISGDNEVRAEFKPEPRVEILEALEPQRPSAARMETQEVSLVEDIISAWDRNVLREKLYFPKAQLSEAELEALWEWATMEGVLIFEDAGAITLLTLSGNEDAAEYSWRPENGSV